MMIFELLSERLQQQQEFRMPEMSSELGRIDLGDITPHNIKLLRKVNTVVFPVSYHDKFYKVRQDCQILDQDLDVNIIQDVLEAGELAKLAFYNDIVVGGVCCRVDTSSVGKKVRKIKIFLSTLFQQNLFSALYYDPWLSRSLQTTWYWDKDVGACSQCCQGGWQLLIHLPPRPDQQHISNRVLQKIWL